MSLVRDDYGLYNRNTSPANERSSGGHADLINTCHNPPQTSDPRGELRSVFSSIELQQKRTPRKTSDPWGGHADPINADRIPRKRAILGGNSGQIYRRSPSHADPLASLYRRGTGTDGAPLRPALQEAEPTTNLTDRRAPSAYIRHHGIAAVGGPRTSASG